jgi:hypothetical protein
VYCFSNLDISTSDQGHFCDRTCRNAVLEVVSQKAATRNGVLEPSFPGISRTTPNLQLNFGPLYAFWSLLFQKNNTASDIMALPDILPISCILFISWRNISADSVSCKFVLIHSHTSYQCNTSYFLHLLPQALSKHSPSP